MKDAQIIVTNQNLLLADLSMPSGNGGYGGVLLPEPSECIYVIDEGHHLGIKAIEQGAMQVAPSPAARRIKAVEAPIRSAYALSGKSQIRGLSWDEGHALLNRYRKQLADLVKQIQQHWTPADDEKSRQRQSRAIPDALWCDPKGTLPEAWRNHATGLSADITQMLRWIGAAHDALRDASKDSGEKALGELGAVREQWKEHARLWKAWAIEEEGEGPPMAKWVVSDARGSLSCHASYVNAARLLEQRLWSKAAGVVLTSATLSAGGNFHPLRRDLGYPAQTECVALASPFDLPTQGRLEIPWMAVEPGVWKEHTQAVTDWLARNLDWGSANLVLFTSKAKMREVYASLPLEVCEKVLMQGVASRNEVLARHRKRVDKGKGSTLFGLASFGEGLDLPGRYLETVVITQIPFKVPNDPVGSTYAAWLERQGRNPFLEVAVPEATRTLVQYCGRLIRTEADTGQVVILDRRIINKRYGAQVLKALPPFARNVEARPAP